VRYTANITDELEDTMNRHRHMTEEASSFLDVNYDEDVDSMKMKQKTKIRKRLEDRLEHKRLKEDLEYFDGELDDEFDWHYIDK